MLIKITIDGPGSQGELLYVVDEVQFKTLKDFAENWNATNVYHAQPFIKLVEVVSDGN